MEEKRAHIRVPVGLKGTYQVIQRASFPRLGITRDLSAGGMRFTCPDFLGKGDRVAVSFTLPEEGPVEMTGEVLWSRELQTEPSGCEAGLRWTEIGSHTQARLNAFLLQRTRADSAVLFANVASVPIPFLIRWPRSIAAGLLIGGGLLMLGWIWFRQAELSREVKALQFLASAFQDHLDRLLR